MDESASAVKLVARQPILDRAQKIYGYELLFRPTGENACVQPKAEASLELIGDSLMLHGLKALVPRGRAFVNLTRADLLAGHARYLPREMTVVEVLETVPADAEVIDTLQQLRRAGYTLALDDVATCERLLEFAGMVHIAKVDIGLAPERERRRILNAARERGIRTLAEKVETKLEFRALAAMGFDYFQGFFFARPEMVGQRQFTAGVASQLQLLRALQRSECTTAEIESVVEQAPAFAYKLLRYLNSPLFGFRSSVRSIRHAITLLGEDEVRRWARLAAVTSMADNASPEMALTAVRRAVFCEELAGCGRVHAPREKLFLAGLLSALDGILDRPRAELVGELSLDPELASALGGGSGELGMALRLALAYDTPDWREVAELAERLQVNDAQLLHAYRAAVDRSQRIVAGDEPSGTAPPPPENAPAQPSLH